MQSFFSSFLFFFFFFLFFPSSVLYLFFLYKTASEWKVFFNSSLVQHALTAPLPVKGFRKSTLTSTLKELKAASSVILATWLRFYADSLNIHWRRRIREQHHTIKRVMEERSAFSPSPLQILKDFFLVWNSIIRKPKMLICYSVVPKSFYWPEARPPIGKIPWWWKSSCLGKNKCQKYMLSVCYEINKDYECIWQSASLSKVVLQQVIALEVEAMHPGSHGGCVPRITWRAISIWRVLVFLRHLSAMEVP